MNRTIACFWVDLLWRLVPLTGFRCWLLDRHLKACPYCQKKLAGQEDFLMVLGGVSEVKLPEEVISRAFGQAEQVEERRPPFLSGRISILLTRIYAAVMAVIIFILLFGFGWYFSQPGPESMAFSPAANETAGNYSALSLNYVRAKGRPAGSLMIYKASDPQMTIIWVQSQN
jgi:hypothetical protein